MVNGKLLNEKSCATHKFRLFPFRSQLLGESHLIYIPGVTKMFQFTPLPPQSYTTHILSINTKLTLWE